ncbi:MAG: response regulator transcription factor [Brevundimonas sp.]|uniref:response regulator n=1 Tax=Brevundimonas sp. TaxID=1871086 RepID=UPI0027340902|nr:response regulator transcription factor [Brevundimonas sp.]MDP3405240.1 response regulator transcription factor [Brevundimonas sp.]
MIDAEPPRRIAILEDDPHVMAHFVDIISASPTLEICATAGTLAEARAMIPLDPDLVLSDIGLPDGSGLDFIPELKAGSSCKTLVVTAFGDRDTVVTALSAGADGYLLKDSSPEVILEGIHVTLMGGAPISASAAVYLLDRLRQREPDPVVKIEPGLEHLTPREIELLKVFARGQSYKEAARSLGISPLTVGNHVKAIYRKLEVNSRGEAVYAAMRRGDLQV